MARIVFPNLHVRRCARYLPIAAVILCLASGALGEGSGRACISQIMPVYPQMARQIRVEGVVILLATVEPDGHVSAAKVVSGHPMLVHAAVDAAMRWKFTPAVEANYQNIRIEFKL